MDTWPAVAEERLPPAPGAGRAAPPPGGGPARAGGPAGLTPQQWETPSLCGAWTVRAVATHLLLPLERGIRGFLPDLVRAHGNLHDASELGVARAMERMTTAQVVAGLRAQAGNRFRPPTMPPAAPLTEVLVHGQDILVPLGIDF